MVGFKRCVENNLYYGIDKNWFLKYHFYSRLLLPIYFLPFGISCSAGSFSVGLFTVWEDVIVRAGMKTSKMVTPSFMTWHLVLERL